ncbi:NgoFVII family restriction endonuclease [Gammaproteobacteria bacterium]|nr:NgoFVII family restriction endonuclease [Gammaproteobacteria bacterium]
MLYIQNLEELILKRHHQNNADQLIVLGGFIGPSPVEKIAKEDIKSSIIYGCKAKANFNSNFDKKYKEISSSTKSEVFYKKSYNHSKIYCWLEKDNIIEIIAGSANFSTNGLNNDFEEVLFDVNKADYSATYQYMVNALKDSESCLNYIHNELLPDTKLRKIKGLDTVLSYNPPSARLSLRSSKGEFEKRSGLNVGQAKLSGSHVNINDAYIPLRKEIIEELPELFPNNGVNKKIGTGYGSESKKKKPNAEFLFDDQEVMEMSFEGKGPEIPTGNVFKQIRSFKPNSRLGEYIRGRMNIEDGKPFTNEDFKRYGRDTIDITLLDDGVYYADFSVNKD